MTKNEDVGYKFYPDTPKSREQYKNLVLKSISTAELVAELKTRPHDEICPVINEMGEPACIFVIPTKSLVSELATRHGVTKYPRWVTSEEVFGHRLTMSGDCTILVVRE